MTDGPPEAAYPRSERPQEIKEGSRLAALWLSVRKIVLRFGYGGKFHVLYLGASHVNAAIGPSHIGS
jgi:hypothetical protein